MVYRQSDRWYFGDYSGNLPGHNYSLVLNTVIVLLLAQIALSTEPLFDTVKGRVFLNSTLNFIEVFLKQNLNLTSSPIKSLLFKIAIPSMTGSLFQTIFNLVDIFYAGKISPDALAALAKAFPLYFIIISAGIGIIAGGVLF